MPYAEQTTGLLNLAENDSDAVDEALEAGAADIDAAFFQGGYAVPLDLSVLEEPAKARWTAKLAVVNRHLAARILASGSLDVGPRGAPSGVKRDYDEAKAWLEVVAEGKLTINGLARSAGATGITVVGDSSFDHAAVEAAIDIRNATELAGEGPADAVV